MSTGRCGVYKAAQPVEGVSGPHLARQLRQRGHDTLRGPLPIADSYLPPDYCRTFALDRARLRANDVPWPGRSQRALLALAAQAHRPTPEAR
jgi:hypothetical protein